MGCGLCARAGCNHFLGAVATAAGVAAGTAAVTAPTAPEAATGGGLALVKSGDKVRIDLKKRRADMLVPTAELKARREALDAKGGYAVPPSQTPWQEIQRGIVDELAHGMVLKPAVKYQKIHATFGVPRDNH